VQAGPGIDRVATIDVQPLPGDVGDGASQRIRRTHQDHAGGMRGQGLLPSGAGLLKTEDLVYPRAGIGDFVTAVDGHANGGIWLRGVRLLHVSIIAPPRNGARCRVPRETGRAVPPIDTKRAALRGRPFLQPRSFPTVQNRFTTGRSGGPKRCGSCCTRCCSSGRSSTSDRKPGMALAPSR